MKCSIHENCPFNITETQTIEIGEKIIIYGGMMALVMTMILLIVKIIEVI